jgi:hypothetical protein
MNNEKNPSAAEEVKTRKYSLCCEGNNLFAVEDLPNLCVEYLFYGSFMGGRILGISTSLASFFFLSPT